MQQLDKPIQKSIMEEEDRKAFKAKAINTASLGYKGIRIDIFVCPLHSNEFLISVCGLGHTMEISYWVEPEYNKTLNAENLMLLAYDDFKDFLLYEREETNLTIH